MEFQWDAEKDVQNRRKHGVSFAEAAQLLGSDTERLEMFDRRHSEDEDRFITIGTSPRGVLVVVWTERENEAIRLISARLATRREQAMYRAYLEEHRE